MILCLYGAQVLELNSVHANTGLVCSLFLFSFIYVQGRSELLFVFVCFFSSFTEPLSIINLSAFTSRTFIDDMSRNQLQDHLLRKRHAQPLRRLPPQVLLCIAMRPTKSPFRIHTYIYIFHLFGDLQTLFVSMETLAGCD